MAEQKTVRKRKRFHWSRDDTELTLLAFPTFIWYVLFAFLPMFGVIIAFKQFTIKGNGFISDLFTSDWAGFDNFKFLFESNDAFIIIRNTILYNLVFISLGLLIPVTLAVLISELHNKKIGKICQTAMFLPHFMSWVIVTYFVVAFLSYDKGLFNSIAVALGGEPIQWYMEEKYWPFFLVFLNVWKGMGYSMVVYLATITGIDGTYYEAALIDGASKWQQVKYITLPILKTIIVMMFILNIGKIFYSDFGLFYQVPRASPSLFNVTETIDTYIYKALGGSVSMGMPSAAAFLQSVLGCITILGANWVVSKVDSDSAII